jgi:hypothetical protein
VIVDDDQTPIEDRLRSALAAGMAQVEAEAGPPVADPADLARRRVQHHRGQRVGRAAAVAAVVLAAAVGGWALGRDTGGTGGTGDVEKVAGVDGSTTVASPPTTEDGRVQDAGAVPIVVPQPPAPGVDSGGAARSHSADSSLVPQLQPWYDGEPLPTSLASTRELPDGATARVRINHYDPAIYELPPFWEPPAWCFPAGDVEIAVTGVGDVARTVRYDAVEDGAIEVRTNVIGGPEGPFRWLSVVQGPAGTARVRVEYPGGQSDEVAPVDGLAVLSPPVAPGTDLDGEPGVVTAVALAADGPELARTEGPWGTDADPPYRRPACAVPTELPSPGPEQPADPVAAEAAVRAVWDAAFAHPGRATVDEQLAAVEDGRGVRRALQRVLDGVSDQVLSETTIALDGLVFAGPDRAFVHYTVDILTGTYASLFGELVLVDGDWKVTRRTACDLAETGGGICEPLVGG